MKTRSLKIKESGFTIHNTESAQSVRRSDSAHSGNVGAPYPTGELEDNNAITRKSNASWISTT